MPSPVSLEVFDFLDSRPFEQRPRDPSIHVKGPLQGPDLVHHCVTDGYPPDVLFRRHRLQLSLPLGCQVWL